MLHWFILCSYRFIDIPIKPIKTSGIVRNIKEEERMNCHANKCVECTVHECAHHCQSENYCSLDKILVGTHETNPTMDQCTDCMSFRRK